MHFSALIRPQSKTYIFPTIYLPQLRFVTLEPAVCLVLSSDSTSRWTSLNSAKPQGLHSLVRGTFQPPKYILCLAHQEKTYRIFRYTQRKCMCIKSDRTDGFRIIIMTEANSSVKSKVLKLLPKLKTEETDGLCFAQSHYP